MIDQIAQQPIAVSLLLIVAVIFFVYTLLGAFKLHFLNRLLCLIPILMTMSIIYMEQSPLIATLLLSSGFLLSFLLAFTLLAGPKK